MEISYYVGVLLGATLMAVIAQTIGKNKGYSNCWAWGFFLGLIGVIVVACFKNKNITNINNKYDDLDKLQKLKDSGTISEEEFEKEKKKLLN